MVVEARGLDEVTPGEFIECQALRPNSGALCNSKIIKGQECEGPGKEWPEKKEEKQERVILNGSSWLSTIAHTEDVPV